MNRTTTRFTLGAAVMMAAWPLFAAPAAQESALDRARSAAALGDTARALAITLEGLDSSPGDRDLFLYAVEVLPERPSKEAGRLAAAAAARLEKKKDGHYAWYLGLCKAMRVSDKPVEAVANCKKALESDPTAYPVYRELGLTYAASGNPRKAAETLEQGVEISSSDFKAHYHLASVLEARGDGARASAAYSRSMALAKRSADPEAARYRAMIRAGLKRAGQKKPKPVRRQAAAAKTATPQQAAACLEKFRAEFLKDNLGSALEQSEACVKFSPDSPELASERAPLMVRLGKYEEGVKEYERAAVLHGANNQMSAFCRVKAAETWLKLRDHGRALTQYRLALAANPQDLNALKGLAEVQESASDRSGALQTYEAILKADPGNQRAKTRSEELKTDLLTDAEILAELKLRQAADEQKTALSPEDSKLFRAIKAAELSGAVDYLKAKAPSARGMTAERRTPGGVKLLLTGAGYRAYVFHATNDAVKLFEDRGVGLREIFQLRDLSGNPVFDAAGKLTPEGEAVWRSGGETRKTWLLPGEPVQESPQAKAAKEQMAALAGRGFAEISEPEYLWLLKVTRCPEVTLQKSPVSAIKQLNDGTRPIYMLCYEETGECKNLCNSKLSLYIGKYRNNDVSDIENDYSTAFFGRGAVKKRRFCENGEVWLGDVGISKDKNPCEIPQPSPR
ncbi:MAG: tetratricopeptide repeat protein [Elusimicrobiales bacterium]